MFSKSKRIKDSAARKKAKQKWCEHCGCAFGVIQIHHIIPKGAGGPDIEENLISLCPACHQQVHAGNISRERMWDLLSIRLNRDPGELKDYVIAVKNGVIAHDAGILQ